MSRDFELLQRLEQNWDSTSALRDLNNVPIHIAAPADASEIAQETTPSALPQLNAAFDPIVRNELNKLVLRTFLSTPSIKVVMFTGVEAQESAKWIASCTASILASGTRGRVCLLDADTKFPTAHKTFSISNDKGLAAVFTGLCSAGQATVRVADNLWIIPAGSLRTGAQITAAMFQDVVVNLLEQFEYVIISAPDCDRFAELGIIGAATEGAVLVLDARTTRRIVAQDAKAALEMAKIRVLGSVIDNQTSPVPDAFASHL
jgi:Mrp family chromosome partitioning ATPase